MLLEQEQIDIHQRSRMMRRRVPSLDTNMEKPIIGLRPTGLSTRIKSCIIDILKE